MASLNEQLQLLRRNPLPFIIYIDKVKEIYRWECMINGPEDTPYANGVFKISLHFRDDFPNTPPVVRFLNRIHHPNVRESGLVTLRILRPNGWDSSVAVADLIEAIWKMLAEPEVEDQASVVESIRDQFLHDSEVFSWVAQTISEDQTSDSDI